MAMSAPEAVVKVTEALDAAAIPYMLTGSLSSNNYGRARSTADADFVIELKGGSIQKVFETLKPYVIFDPQLRLESVTFTLRWVGVVVGSEFKIELFQVNRGDAHDSARFDRRLAANLFGRQIMIPTVEDVIVQKLRWYGRQKRTKDLEDLKAVLAIQAGRVDLAYIRHWADAHGTRDIFEDLRRQAEKFET